MENVNTEVQTAIPSGEQSTQVVTEQEIQPGTQNASETGAEQTSTTEQLDPSQQHAEQIPGDKKRSPWYQVRINELTRERKEAQEASRRESAERERLQRELEALRQTPQDPTLPTTSSARTDPAHVDVNALHAQWLSQKNFDDACTALYEAGTHEFTDFDDVIKQVAMVGEIPKHFYEALTAVDGGHKVLHHLGENPDLAAELLALAPVQLAIRMADLSGQLSRPQTKPVSRTPAPIKPIDGNGRADVDLSKASLDDFMARRNREAPVQR
jgi:hypothetical protein